MSKDIVVMIDMQNDFIDGSLGSPAAQAIVPKVVEYLKNLPANVLVFYTQDTHYQDYLEDTLEGKMLPIVHCVEGTDGWKINKDVMNACMEHEAKGGIVHSRDKETFGSVWLMRDLDCNSGDAEETTFHCFGLCTDICVVSNALMMRERFPNSRIICHADMCAGTSPDAHKAALTVMKSCQIEIVGE